MSLLYISLVSSKRSTLVNNAFPCKHNIDIIGYNKFTQITKGLPIIVNKNYY